MSRLSSPGFRLFSAPLTQAAELGLTQTVIKTIIPKTGLKTPDLGFTNVPIALRWTTDPAFGYPRQPFNVYRRPRQYDLETVANKLDVAGEITLFSPQGDLFLLLVNVSLSVGQQLTFEPLDRQNTVITGKTVRVTTIGSTTFQLRGPNISAVRVRGTGFIAHADGVVQGLLINKPDWELIQRVGLPLAKGELPDSVYHTFPQGWVGAPDVAGDTFARFRLKIGELLHLPMPLLPGGIQPDWKAPNTDAFAHYLHTAPDSLLTLIKMCLNNTDDTAADPALRQQAFVAELEVKGLRQDGFPGNIQPATVKIPVVQTGLLAASTDNYASLALGYGTYDFSQNNIPVSRQIRSYDYMVTATYVVRPSESIFDFSVSIEFAALSEERPLPEIPTNLRVVLSNPPETQPQNRPLLRNEPTTEPVKLAFGLPKLPQSYGIVRSSVANNAQILNNPKPYSPGSFDPYLPTIPLNTNEAVTGTFTDPFSPIPLSGTDLRTYFMAGLDVFGRWSGYTQQNYIAKALLPQKPGLQSVTLRPNAEIVAGGSPPTIPCTIEIDFSWDWTERTPQLIELGGGFYPADATSPTRFTDRFAQQSTNAPLPVVQITFSPLGTPITTVGTVYTLTNSDAAADPNIRRYRLIIDTMQPTFPGPLLAPVAGLSKVAYSVVARALESVRVAAAEFCEWREKPVVTNLTDPRPPVMVSLPADIRWTALPDATRVARAKLSWPAIAGASGYVVWQASETALREMLGEAHRPLDPYTTRATELRDLLTDATKEIKSLKSFTRLNRDPIQATFAEVDLPGSASTLFVYRVSALNGANLESGKSNALFVAVPRLNQPTQPGLRLTVIRQADGSAAIDIGALNGAGLPPAGFRVYRVRKALPINDVGLKGLPLLQPESIGWQPLAITALDGTQQLGQVIRQVITERSWTPYYYQVVAVGAANPAEGLLAGESDGSPTEIAYLPPDTAPTLTVLNDTHDAQIRLLELSTSIPVGPLVLGTLTRYVEDGIVKTGRIGESQVEVASYLSISPDDLPQRQTRKALAISKVTLLSAAPGLTFPPFDTSQGVEISRIEGNSKLFIRLPVTITSGFVRVMDPLGRSTETFFTTP